jgi:hypothetical protein
MQAYESADQGLCAWPPLALLALLAARCLRHQPDALINKEIEQSGPLKVHPGLVESLASLRDAGCPSVSAPDVAAEDAKAMPLEQARPAPDTTAPARGQQLGKVERALGGQLRCR